MTLDKWMEELADLATMKYGYDAYRAVVLSPWNWEDRYSEGLTPEQALWTEFGS